MSHQLNTCFICFKVWRIPPANLKEHQSRQMAGSLIRFSRLWMLKWLHTPQNMQGKSEGGSAGSASARGADTNVQQRLALCTVALKTPLRQDLEQQIVYPRQGRSLHHYFTTGDHFNSNIHLTVGRAPWKPTVHSVKWQSKFPLSDQTENNEDLITMHNQLWMAQSGIGQLDHPRLQ